MGFFGDLKASRLWAKSLTAHDAEDFDEAVRLLEKMASMRPLKAFEMARLGTNYVSAGRSDAARPLFEAARERTAGKAEGTPAYINRYCDFYLRLLEGEVAEKDIDCICEIRCSRSVKRWLPLR